MVYQATDYLRLKNNIPIVTNIKINKIQLNIRAKTVNLATGDVL